MLSAEGGSFWSDVGTWLKRGRPGPEEDVEKGV